MSMWFKYVDQLLSSFRFLLSRICFLLIFLHLSLSAQVNFHEIDYIKVSNGTRFLDYPWAGGLNSAQFCDPDLNNDGIKDLLIFEKTENRVLTFIADGKGNYLLNRGFITNIPTIEGWVVTKDMNCDGIDDFFTYHNGSMRIYKGHYDNDTLKFSLWADEILYESSFGIINLYSSFVDRPAIADFDFDGDLDILTYNVSANRMALYQNMRKEKNLSCDELNFILKDNCWGNVYESGFSPIMEMRDTCTGKINNARMAVSAKSFHVGSTLEAADIRGRGVLDIIMGDASLELVNHLYNDGDRRYASILQQDTSYPSYDVPARITSFPLTTFIDVNQDGIKDFIVTPFEGLGVDNYENVLLYQGTQKNQVSLSFVTNSFMVGDMIDVGENAVPTLLDIDGDGLKDLIIGGTFRKGNTSHTCLHYYKNIGTLESPAFELKDNDFLNFSSLNFQSPHPHAGDLDGDEKNDLLIGLQDGRILYYKNINTELGFKTNNYSILQVNGHDLDVGLNAAPFITDINKDGKKELFVGSYKGSIQLYTNDANPPNINLKMLADSVGKITTTSKFMPFGYSSIAVADIDKDGKLDMIIGGYDNYLKWVSDIEDSLYLKTHPQVFSSLPLTIGRQIAPHFEDITNQNDGTLLLGLQAGGIRWLSIHPPKNTSVGIRKKQLKPLDFQIYPNPSSDKMTILLPNNEISVFAQVIDMTGKVLNSTPFFRNEIHIDISQLHRGIYTLYLKNRKGVSGSQLFVKD